MTGSTLQFRIGDASDSGPPAPRDRPQSIVAIGSVGDGADVMPFTLRSKEPNPIVWVELDGELLGGVGAHWPDGEAGLAAFVDQVQEQFLDEEIGGGWPFCPEHGAHLDCELRDGIAAWVCPRGETVARVGDLI